MATGPLRKRLNKRSSDPKPRTAMATRPSSPKFYKNTSLILLIFLIIAAFVLLGISSNIFSTVGYSTMFTGTYSIEVVNEFPHDPNAFTQSSVRKVDIQTGKVEVLQEMDSRYFGEGLTLLGERLFQVTWLTKTGFKYDRNDLSKSEKFTHQMQDGWGLATDGKVLFGSDGSSVLYKIDPQTLKVIDKHVVKYKDHEVHNLNELEFIKGEVWANVYQAIDVLNGIAWDSDTNRIFVTGKLWPKLYEIKLHPVKKQFKDGAIEQLCLRQTFFH